MDFVIFEAKTSSHREVYMEGNFGECYLVLVMLLFVMLELESLKKNPVPPTEQDKIDHILKQIIH